MAEPLQDPLRVRFAPSPTGYLHIGGARTVLFNWLLARRSGGSLILRIEDTDRARHVEGAVERILEDLRWLGLEWDEGPEMGGSHGPYFQSERLEIYNSYLQPLLESKKAYYALETPEELQAIRDAAERQKRPLQYPRPVPLPTIEEGRSAIAEGRPVVVRLLMPEETLIVHDQVLGEVRIEADQLDDFIIQKSDGFPTYHFACVVDDATMGITHVLRGQEHLMNTPKHIALQRALGFQTPVYAHLPMIFNMEGGKMSKRDKEVALRKGVQPPEIEVHDFRSAGFLPEAVVNFIALLGWSPGDDRERFSLEELVSVFRLERVGKTNARFDREKLLSFNTDWATRVTPKRLLEAFEDFLSVRESPLREADRTTRERILEECKGFRTFQDVENKTRFLFTADEAIEYDAKAVKKNLAKREGAGYAMLEHVLPKLEAVSPWTATNLEVLLEAVCADRGVNLGAVAQPIRVAITGTPISPAIYASLEMLGKERTLARIKRCLDARP